MRILYSHRIRSRDGQAVHVEALVGAFRSEGHEVVVVGPPAFERAGFGDEGRALGRLRRLCPAFVYELLELLYNIPAVVRLCRVYRQFRPDCVYERYNLYYFGGLALKRLYGVPLHLEINSPLAAERAAHGNLALKGVAGILERWVWRSADHVYPVSGILAETVARVRPDRHTITVNHNGIDLDEYGAAPVEPPETGAKLTLGFIGFLRPWHGVDHAIRLLAAASAPSHLRLVVVGDGPARPELESLANALGVADRVDFLGLVPRQRLAETICGFDIALQPMATLYASPLKLFEYMAFARPIVAPDQPNIREILVHDRTALLFNPDDPVAMQAPILRLCGDPELRQRLGQAAQRELLERDYTWRGNARRIAAIAARGIEDNTPKATSTTSASRLTNDSTHDAGAA